MLYIMVYLNNYFILMMHTTAGKKTSNPWWRETGKKNVWDVTWAPTDTLVIQILDEGLIHSELLYVYIYICTHAFARMQTTCVSLTRVTIVIRCAYI